MSLCLSRSLSSVEGLREGGTQSPQTERETMKLCVECKEQEATEANDSCFMCAEEMAYLLGDLQEELGVEIPKNLIARIAYGQKS